MSSLRDIGRVVIEDESLKNAKSLNVLDAKVNQLRQSLGRCETDLKNAISKNDPEQVGALSLEKNIISEELTETLRVAKVQSQLEEFEHLKHKACDDPGITSVGAFLWVCLVRHLYWITLYPKWPSSLVLTAWVFHQQVVESEYSILGLLFFVVAGMDIIQKKPSLFQAVVVLGWFIRMHYWMCNQSHPLWNVLGATSASLLFCRVCYDYAMRH